MLPIGAVASAVQTDLEALNRGCRLIESYDSPINENEYRIALRVSDVYYVNTMNGAKILWDYHFMVQTSTGRWAEKHGPKGETIEHLSGNPSTISWDWGNWTGFYTSDIIYFAITN